MHNKMMALGFSAVLLTGCASPQPDASLATATNQDDVPEWVLMPEIENGLAAATCVNWSGSISVDRAEAVALARAALAQNIKLKASVLDKTYLRKNENAVDTQAASTFEQVSKQVTDTLLQGASARKVALGKIDDKKQLCALVGMDNNQTKQLFNAMVEQSGQKFDPTNEAAMYEEFRAQKANEALEAELKKMTQ